MIAAGVSPTIVREMARWQPAALRTVSVLALRASIGPGRAVEADSPSAEDVQSRGALGHLLRLTIAVEA